jgi:hypothetical protein
VNAGVLVHIFVQASRSPYTESKQCMGQGFMDDLFGPSAYLRVEAKAAKELKNVQMVRMALCEEHRLRAGDQGIYRAYRRCRMICQACWRSLDNFRQCWRRKATALA